MKIIKKISLVLAMATMSSTVFAAGQSSATGNFESTAMVNSSCQVTVNPLSFGTITSNATDMLATSTMTFTCSKGLGVSITMDGGNSGNRFERYMIGSNGNNDQLKYNVFTPSRGYDDNDSWGAGTTEDFSTDGKPQVLSILGKVYGNQYIKPDNYTDSLRVVLTY